MKRLVLLLVLLLISATAFASVNTLTGSMSHRQTLFSAQGGTMPLRMELQYNSYDKIAGQVGFGWSHSYEIYLHQNSDGTLVLTGGVGKRFYFPDGNGNYVARTGDYSTLTANPDSSYTINFSDGRIYQFGSNLKIVAITDRHGQALTFDHSVADQLTVTDTANRQTVIHFDANGRVDQVLDPANSPFDLAYNANSQLESIAYPEPRAGAGRPTWNFYYTVEQQLEYIQDPNLQISKYVYALGKVVRTVAPEGVIDINGSEVANAADYSKSYDYNSNNPLSRSLTLYAGTPTQTTLTERDGGQWITLYVGGTSGLSVGKQDPLGNITEYSYYPSTSEYYGKRQYRLTPMSTEPSGANTLISYRLTSTNSYDASGNATDVTTRVRKITFDATGQVVTTVDEPIHRHRTYTYGSYNRQTSIVDQIAGTTTTFDYLTLGDGREQVTITAPKINAGDSSGPQTIMVYRTDGQLDSITDPLQRTVDYQYDANGLLTSTTDPNNIVSQFSNFDVFGLAQTITLTANDGSSTRTTGLQYDALSRLIKITQGAGTPLVTEFDYDGVGNRNLVVDAEGNETSFEHSSKGQVTKITNVLNAGTAEEQVLDTLLDYQGAGGCSSCGGAGDKLKVLTDAKNQATMFGYDALGRLERETDPLNKVISYSYTTDGRPKQKFLGEPLVGQLLLTYEYTTDGKLQYKRDVANNILVSYSYYPDGQLQTAATLDSSSSMTYYANGLLKTVDNGSYVIDYQYDLLGRRELVTIKQGATVLQSVDYDYDSLTKELKDIVASNAGTFNFAYDAFGRRSSLTYPNGVVGSYRYDDLNKTDWLTEIKYTDGVAGPDILNVGYPQHDKVGNRKQRVEDGVVTDYQYDDLYQVTQAKTGASEENFVWDVVGNRRGGPTVKEVVDVTYQYNAANQMEQGRKYGYDYDDFGNQRHRYLNAAKTKYWEFNWTPENQLQKAQLIDGGNTLRILNFKYDAFGRRIEKQAQGLAPAVPVPLTTLTTTYVYDGEDIILQLVNDGTTTTVSQFVHGPGIDEPLALVKAGQSSFYHADGLGSVLALSDGAKNIVQRYQYDTFGSLTAILDVEFGNAYTYTGREWDREFGLYYYRARYYDAMEGRFISKDPIGFAGGDVNVYGYVLNNPANWIDPTGQIKIHGNWCGGNWTGAQKEQYSPVRDVPKYYMRPTDALDTACQAHDKTYEKCRRKYPCNTTKRAECFIRADGILAGEASRLSIVYSVEIKWAMNR